MKKERKIKVWLTDLTEKNATFYITIDNREYGVIYTVKDNGSLEIDINYGELYDRKTLESDGALIQKLVPSYFDVSCDWLEAKAQQKIPTLNK